MGALADEHKLYRTMHKPTRPRCVSRSPVRHAGRVGRSQCAIAYAIVM